VSIDLARARERAFAGNQVEGIERRVDSLNPIERVLADLGCGRFAVHDELSNFAGVEDVGHPMTRGTRKSPAPGAASGALARASLTGRHGFGVSSRSALWAVT